MDAATAGDHRSRWRHHLRLQLPLPMSQICFSSLRSQWICNDHAGFWIRVGGRQVFKTDEWSGSASNAGCRDGYNATHWVRLCGSAGCWCVTTACNWRGGWSNNCPSLCSGLGGRHTLSDICNAWIVHRRWGDGVLTLDCRGYRSPPLREIRLAIRYGNESLTNGKLRIPWWLTLLLILTNSKTLNISYDQRRDRPRALGRHHPIWMFTIDTVGIVSSVWICNSRRGWLLFARPCRDSTKQGGAV